MRVSRPPALHGDGGIQVAVTTRDGRRVCSAVSDYRTTDALTVQKAIAAVRRESLT